MIRIMKKDCLIKAEDVFDYPKIFLKDDILIKNPLRKEKKKLKNNSFTRR